MKILSLLCNVIFLCVTVCEVKTKQIRINDVMELIKHVINDMAQMNNHFQKKDDDLNKKIGDVEVSTIERVSRVEKVIGEKIENLEVKTIERVQKLSERFTEQLRIRDIQMKEELDLRDLQMTTSIKRMREDFLHRLGEEQQQIDKLKEENTAMKKEMKKCIGGKDLSKNVSILVEKQSHLESKQNEQSKVLRRVENEIEKSVIERQNISNRIHVVDKDVDELQKKSVEVQSGVKLLNSAVSVLKGDIVDEVRKRSIAIVTVRIVQAEESRQLASMKKSVEDTHEVVDEVRESVKRLKRSAKKANATMICFKKEVNEKLDGMSKRNITILKKEVMKNTKEIRNANKNISQVQMYLRYKSTELGLTFKEILNLVGEENFMEKKSIIVQKLLHEKEEFEKYQEDWNILFRDVIRLTDGTELKEGRNLTTIKKLLILNKVFASTFQMKWGIEFKDVVRLTAREDMKNIPLKDARNSIAILEKIDQLFNAFTPYKDVWKIHFKDIVDLTVNLNFTDATKSPALAKVKSWYVPGFTDVWGESFHGFFHIMKQQSTRKQTELLGKIQAVAEKEKKKRFLKMLPATFEYDGKKLSVHGYIQVFYNDRNGTVWIKSRTNPHYQFTEATATTLCAAGGYKYTSDGWNFGKYRDGKGTDRSKMRCLISGLGCLGQGTETDLYTCMMDEIIDPTTRPPTTARVSTATPTTTPKTTTKPTPVTKKKPIVTTQKPVPADEPLLGWDHSEDVAIKCNF